MKLILHTTDYSKNATTALHYAYKLSKKLNAVLWVIHVFDISALSADINESHLLSKDEHLKQKNAKLMEYCTSELGNLSDDKNIYIEAIENKSVLQGIVSKATKLNACLIVAGMKGKSAIKEFLIGSTTKKLIEKAPCPVLAIPEDVALNTINTIVYTTDYEEEDINAISWLSELAATFKSSIKIVHISLNNKQNGSQEMEWFREMLREKVDYPNLEFDLLYSDEIYPILKLFSEEVNADLIAMLERKKKGIFKKIAHQDLVKKMESNSNIPIISFNENNLK